MEHQSISLLSDGWWVGVSASAGLILVTCVLFTTSGEARRSAQAHVLGGWIVLEFCLTQGYVLFVQGTWTLADSLPLHLCRIAFPVAGLCLLTRNQLLYEFSVYMGIPGGLVSILTPELTQGNAPWMLFDYYCGHALMVAVPLIMTLAFGMRPRKGSVMRMLIIVHLLAAIVFPLNLVLGSNYMYINEKPLAENPLLIGPWPWYLISLEVALILHFLLLDLLFRVRPYGSLRRLLLGRIAEAGPAATAAGRGSAGQARGRGRDWRAHGVPLQSVGRGSGNLPADRREGPTADMGCVGEWRTRTGYSGPGEWGRAASSSGPT
jgi:hypothetical integral membrane protein (TIGR02206 family)